MNDKKELANTNTNTNIDVTGGKVKIADCYRNLWFILADCPWKKIKDYQLVRYCTKDDAESEIYSLGVIKKMADLGGGAGVDASTAHAVWKDDRQCYAWDTAYLPVKVGWATSLAAVGAKYRLRNYGKNDFVRVTAAISVFVWGGLYLADESGKAVLAESEKFFKYTELGEQLE